MSSLLLSTKLKARDKVYVAAVPLGTGKGPAQLLMSVAYSFNLLHFIVLIKQPLHSQVHVLDFQPKDPESLESALAVISGRPVPGVVKVRKLSKVPTRKCWFIGCSKEEDATLMATEFNKTWNTHLRVGHHDCGDYTNGLIEHLTGEKRILDQLRASGKLD